MNKTFKFFVDTTFRTSAKMGGFKVLLPAGLFAVGVALLFADGFGKNPFEVKGVVIPRPTDAELQARRKEVQSDGKIEMAAKPITLTKIRSEKTDSLIKRSTVLSFGESWTIVPKESILHVPKHLAKRVDAEKQGTLVAWKEFQEKNRGWLQLQNVTLSQARGEEQFSDAAIESYRSSGRVVVAVCHDGPISVKSAKTEVGVQLTERGTLTVKPALKQLHP